MKKILIATCALAMLASPIAASAQPFGRDGGGWRGSSGADRGYQGRGFQGRHDRGFDRRGDDGGGALAAGLFGLFLGAAIADSQPAYDYPPYRTRCDWETRAYPGPYGEVSYQQVQVCR